MVLFNRHVNTDEKFDEHNMTVHWSMVGLPPDAEVGFATVGGFRAMHALCRWRPGLNDSCCCCCAAQVMVRDIYKERDIGRFVGTYRDVVDAHGVLALKLTPIKCAAAAKGILFCMLLCSQRQQHRSVVQNHIV